MFETNTFDDPDVVPPKIRSRYEFMETGSAASLMQKICPAEWQDILEVLGEYQLDPQTWMKAGGNRGDVAKELDAAFEKRGWAERRLDIETRGFLVDRAGNIVEELEPQYQEGYLVDNFKGRVALDVEWNAKDGNLDRDMTAYRTWYEAGAISAAVIITKDQTSLKRLLGELWQGWNDQLPPEEREQKLPIDMNTSTTTNLSKAALRVRRGVMGTCPLLIIAVSRDTWNWQQYVGVRD